MACFLKMKQNNYKKAAVIVRKTAAFLALLTVFGQKLDKNGLLCYNTCRNRNVTIVIIIVISDIGMLNITNAIKTYRRFL